MELKQKLLIIHQGAIGDLILSLPAFAAIRKAFQGHSLEILGYRRTLNLIHKRFYADSVSSIDRASCAQLYQDDGIEAPELLEYLAPFATIIVFGGRRQEILVRNISRATAAQVFRIPPFPGSAGVHVVDFQLEHLRRCGIKPGGAVPELFLSDADMARAGSFLRARGIDFEKMMLTAIHPGSGSSRKNWPSENFIALINRLSGMRQCCFLLIEGPAEEELAAALQEQLAPMRLLWVRQPELVLLAALLKHCSLYIGNDSGVTHIAAALGIPVIALFGPTDPGVWGPRGQHVCILRGSDPQHGQPWPGVDAVAEKAAAVLADAQPLEASCNCLK